MKACRFTVGGLILGVLLFLVSTSTSWAIQQEQTTAGERFKDAASARPHADMSLSEIDRQLSNVLSGLWSLAIQNNLSLKRGGLIEGTEWSDSLFFQPSLPVPIGRGKDWVFIARPVFPFVSNPILDHMSADGVSGRESGFGDIQLMSLVGPNRKEGLVWGVGPTFKFPTASDAVLGQGKYQAGPAGLLTYLSKQWTLGINVQHWMSYAGSDDRPATAQTDIDYVIVDHLPGGWSVGMTPKISIDWEAKSDDRLTLPVGFGVGRVIRIGKTPMKIRFEVQYAVVRPESYGTAWNFRLQLVPVIPNPFR